MSEATRLTELVSKEAFLWGHNVAEAYHGAAQRDMDAQWTRLIRPALDATEIDYSNTIDFACGYGRNAEKLLELSESVTCVDVNSDNIEFCKDRFAGDDRVKFFQNNGIDLSGLGSNSYSLVYSWDAMVHFDMEIVFSYIREFYRVLAPNGVAAIHHSNYTGSPGGSFRTNPAWRNFMSADIFRHVAIRAGFVVSSQTVFDWGRPEIDCISVLIKRVGAEPAKANT